MRYPTTIRYDFHVKNLQSSCQVNHEILFEMFSQYFFQSNDPRSITAFTTWLYLPLHLHKVSYDKDKLIEILFHIRSLYVNIKPELKK
jgi:hypothetical protein